MLLARVVPAKRTFEWTSGEIDVFDGPTQTLEATMLSSARAVAIVLLGCSGACGSDDTSSASNGATTQPHDAGSDTDADTDDTFAAAGGGVTTGMFGKTTGVKLWVFPDGPDGLHPDQSWSSIAPAPDGSIYATGCDSQTNGALYRLLEANDKFGYVGDARTASIAGGNWGPNQNAEQFQVRPLWYREHVYLASSGYVTDGDSRKYRGFHWYTYDLRTRQLIDLSANEAAGVGAEHISIVATALDTAHGYLYALGSPTAHLYQYEIAAGRTVDLGRHPELVQPYYTPGQVLWVDASGRVYFTVANGGTLAPDDIGAPRYVLSWDSEQGWASRPDWPVLDVLRTGQWSLDRKRLYLLDYALNLYVFSGTSFMRLGRGTLDDAHVSEQTNSVRVRSINLSPSERKLYFINDTAKVTSLYEWSFHDGSTPLRRIHRA
jgi:hypothetical protein